MKLILLWSLILFVSIQTYAQQPFAPAGAIWHYDIIFMSYGGFIKIEAQNDSVVQGITCRTLQATEYRWFNTGPGTIGMSIISRQPEFVYQNNDTIFWFQGNTFRVLYNFSAQAGDSWEVTDSVFLGITCTGPSSVEVDSTGSSVISNETLRYFHSNPLPGSSMSFPYRVYERIGSLFYLFPEYNYCDTGIILDAPLYKFHCYQDDNFSLYSPDSSDCEATWWALNTAELSLGENAISVYPNPSDNFISLDLSGDIKSFSIEDHAGRLVFRQDCRKVKKFRVDLSDYSPGVYFLKAIGTSGVLTKKFVRL